MNNHSSFLSLTIIFFFYTILLSAQADCTDPLVLCGESPFMITPSPDNGAIEDDLSDICTTMNILMSEYAPVWIDLNIAGGGELVFTITPPGESDDIDFFVFKLEDGCDTKVTVRCMLSGETAGQDSGICLGPTGLAFGETDVEETAGCSDGSNNFLAPLVVEAGERYMILINEFTQSGNPYEIEFGGTATIDCITSSLEQVSSSEQSIIVAPNVSQSGIFHVQFNIPTNNFTYNIYDATGRLVQQKLNNNNQYETIDLASNPKGVYYMVVESGEIMISERLVIVE